MIFKKRGLYALSNTFQASLKCWLKSDILQSTCKGFSFLFIKKLRAHKTARIQYYFSSIFTLLSIKYIKIMNGLFHKTNECSTIGK